MSRRLILLLAVVVALFTIAPAVGAGNINGNFTAHLSGQEEVPARDTDATGQAIFNFQGDADNRTLSFKLIVANIENVVAAHIHCGAEGDNGPVGVTLYPVGDDPNGAILSQGVILTPDADNLCGWEDLDDVIDAIEEGEAYVNVHTNDGVAPTNTGPGDFPGGEIRGQIG